MKSVTEHSNGNDPEYPLRLIFLSENETPGTYQTITLEVFLKVEGNDLKRTVYGKFKNFCLDSLGIMNDQDYSDLVVQTEADSIKPIRRFLAQRFPLCNLFGNISADYIALYHQANRTYSL